MDFRPFLTGAIAILLAARVSIAASASSSDSETVYQLADGVVRPSRFPGAQEAYLPIDEASNHAANLLSLPNGDLLCFWFAGTWEGKSWRFDRHGSLRSWFRSLDSPRDPLKPSWLVRSEPGAVPGTGWPHMALPHLPASQ